MSDLLGHDLPGPTPNAPLPFGYDHVKVYKEGPWWTWHHRCPDRPKSTPVNGYPHVTQASAFHYANEHARRCL